jgi:hypothetical protein
MEGSCEYIEQTVADCLQEWRSSLYSFLRYFILFSVLCGYSMPHLINMSCTGQSKIKHSRNTGRQGADFIWRELRQDNKVKTATVVHQHHLTGLVPTEGCMNVYSHKDKRQPGENLKHKKFFTTVRHHIKKQQFFIYCWIFYLLMNILFNMVF